MISNEAVNFTLVEIEDLKIFAPTIWIKLIDWKYSIK